ncbi:glutathione-regulated potassium-efflux system oxidoreductase KefF [Tellurirhabdus bombi]|uniref:glutathione-regulated potassium-efflux system oxidoreductase KefF n=1 Tax=Tellurirhabdus bombi TaxID=2907205 RepID=UPI001F4012BB|nr:NAD(P)H-dependent oxidoreductase [Tellurirhabdus bombi]
MSSILILFAHPALEKSRANQILLRACREVESVTVNDLYEQYPDFDIDVDREQQLLIDHDYIILQHPFYWYSSPAMIKQWEDLVLEHGWAYGREGKALIGKKMLNVLTTGGPKGAYQEEGLNRFTMRQLLAPFDQTAHLCKMIYLPPFVIHGTHRLSLNEIKQYAARYQRLLTLLANDELDLEEARKRQYLNELFPE